MEEQIQGMKIRKNEYKMRAFADDVVYILENPINSVNALNNILLEFEKASGLKVNKDKTNLLIKNMNKDSIKLLEQQSGYKESKKVRYLGINLTNRNTDLFHNNYEKVWNDIKNDLNRWEKIKLSLLGKISVTQMNVLPKLLFLFQAIPVLHSFKPLEKWQNGIMKFIWNNRKARIKKKIMCDDKSRGGLGVPNLKVYYFASILLWIMDWILMEDEQLLNLEGENLRFGLHGYLFYNKDKVHNESKRNILIKAMLKVWEKIGPRICSNQIPQCCSPHEAWFNREAIPVKKWIRYSDLIKITEGNIEFKSQEELSDVGISCHWYLFRQLRERWKADKNSIGFIGKITEWEEIMGKGKKKAIARFYKMILCWENEEEIIRSSMIRWAQNVGHNIEYKKWERIWNQGLRYTVNQELKENVYKMIYRWHLSPKKISLMYKTTDSFCWKCLNVTGSYYHMWWTCKMAKKYWLNVYEIITKELNIAISFLPETCLLGIMGSDVERQYGKLLFYLLTCARINYATYWKSNQIPSMDKWLMKVLMMAEMDRMTCWLKEKNEESIKKDWELFYDFLNRRWNNNVLL